MPSPRIGRGKTSRCSASGSAWSSPSAAACRCSEVAFWVDALFRFAATPVENPIRLRALADAVHAGNPGDGVLMERLEALLGMLTQLMRVVLVADDLEGFSTDETAALAWRRFSGPCGSPSSGSMSFSPLNQDIWESAFIPRLSGGLADRLSEVVVELNPLTEDEMVALLESRVPGLGARVLSRVDRASAGTHARGLIRAAGVAWLRASAMDSQPAAAPVIPEPVGMEPAAPVAPAFIERELAPAPRGNSPWHFPLRWNAHPILLWRLDFSRRVQVRPLRRHPGQAPEFTPEPVAEMSPAFAAPLRCLIQDSPFHNCSRASAQQPLQASFAPPEYRHRPAAGWSTPAESQAPACEIPPDSGFQPAPEPDFQPVEQTPPSTQDTDRVDDLLRQFRERYGRGSM